jgi:hypothetical protein
VIDAPINKQSPDGLCTATLLYEGEVRYGPRYYRLVLGGRPVSERLFGVSLEWSDDSRYLATQEWLSTDYAEGPRTRVLLFDTRLGLLASFRTVSSGFAEDFRFHASGLAYRKVWYASKGGADVEVDFKAIHNWQPAS